MNCDIALPNTPAMARRLGVIQRLCKIDLDPAVTAPAADDLLGDDAFEAIGTTETPMRRAAIQFMLDCDLRCAVSVQGAPEIDRDMVLRAVKLAGHDIITVVCNGQVRMWQKLLKQGGFPGALATTLDTAFEPESQGRARAGVLVIEWTTDLTGDGCAAKLEALAREFPRTVVLMPVISGGPTQRSFHGFDGGRYGSGTVMDRSSWWSAASVLFPQMPQAIFNLSNGAFARDVLRPAVWTARERDDLAILYNVFLPSKLADYGQS